MKVDRKCENKKCGMPFKARSADVKRGWARFCSKSCKATAQEARTGQFARVLAGGSGGEDIDYEGGGWDAHKNA
jgi:hypothetical protein